MSRSLSSQPHGSSASPEQSSELRIALLGLGTVGLGVVHVLARNADEIQRRTGTRLRITAVAVRDVERALVRLAQEGLRGKAMPRLTQDPLALAREGDETVVCELMGGIEPAFACVMAAIDAGKHVVTANKALLARHGDAIFARARARGVNVLFEAAVAGGIPIIKALREGLAANRIQWVTGIINGTCNYILSAMSEQGAGFEQVLREAQRLGYAEADPAADVDGHDAAHKLTLLASLAFGIRPRLDLAYVEGIRGVDADDIRYARELGYRIKLLGIARRVVGKQAESAHQSGIELRVHPTLVPAKTVLANVSGVMNAVLVQADAVGQTLYSGAGAGAEPTASSVIADLVDICRELPLQGDGAAHAQPSQRVPQRVPHLAFVHDALEDAHILPIEAIESCYYLRARVDDQPGVLADVARALADHHISVDAMIQPETGLGQTDIVLLTHTTREANLLGALARIRQLPAMRQPPKFLRLEHLS